MQTPYKSQDTHYVYNALETVRNQKAVERSFARLFGTEDGVRVLAHLQVMTFYKAHSAEVSEAELRHAEGQRALVAQMLRLIERGKTG